MFVTFIPSMGRQRGGVSGKRVLFYRHMPRCRALGLAGARLVDHVGVGWHNYKCGRVVKPTCRRKFCTPYCVMPSTLVLLR